MWGVAGILWKMRGERGGWSAGVTIARFDYKIRVGIKNLVMFGATWKPSKRTSLLV